MVLLNPNVSVAKLKLKGPEQEQTREYSSKFLYYYSKWSDKYLTDAHVVWVLLSAAQLPKAIIGCTFMLAREVAHLVVWLWSVEIELLQLLILVDSWL